jgi:hypothetical protein
VQDASFTSSQILNRVAFPAEAPEDDAIDNDLVTTIKIVDHLREVKRPVIVKVGMISFHS